MPVIEKCELENYVGGLLDIDGDAFSLGMVDSEVPSTLTYVASNRYVDDANRNPNVSIVFTNQDLRQLVSKKCIVLDDPVWCFWSLFNDLVERSFDRNLKRSSIAKSATIASSASISDRGVVIGENTQVQENVVVYPGVEIGHNCIIRTGSVIGSDGFEKKRTSKGILSIKHDGRVVIGDEVEIGVLNSVAKGFYGRNTIIGDQTKTDSLVHIGHCIRLGKRCLVTAGTIIGGSVDVGDDCWLGLNSTVINGVGIGSGAFIGLGSTVLRDVSDSASVAGNPARAVPR
jgi:UDP-3-O-[3-hydroxymyristoyl] glucosamine N-acyltransferase